MGAKEMYMCLNAPAPPGKEKHHGNKRKSLRMMKIKARRVDRHKAKREITHEHGS